MIEYLVTRPGELQVAMTVLTIVEAVVGLCLALRRAAPRLNVSARW
jgi:hypothetical protein